MKKQKQSLAEHLRDTTSVLALSAAALFASSGTPAHAQATLATRPIYFGGSTLASLVFRQMFDCYSHGIVGYGTAHSDGFHFGVPTGPGSITTACSTIVTTQVNGLYAGVGAGNGMRGFIANNPQQWYGGTITPPLSGTTTKIAFLPAIQPPIIDYANAGAPPTVFGSYPYPRVDAGLSEAPLTISPGTATLTTVSLSLTPTQSWVTTGGGLSFLTVSSSTTTVSYNPTNFGPLIQIPAFEVNVAIVVNTGGLDQLHSAVAGTGAVPGTQANQGAAIQLTTGQLCAIFSGLVTNWNDTTAINVPYLSSGGVATLGAFSDANTRTSGSGSDAYTSISKSITVVYNYDESGESYILTNYLKNVCPLLDPTDSKKYRSIFGASNLPSTRFANLIDNIKAFRTYGYDITVRWIAAIGSSGVASAVSANDPTKGGRVGYVGANLTYPYTTTVAGVTAPLSAALQNEQLRIAGVTVPNDATGTLTFIAPTPGAALNAWSDTRLRTTATTWTWADFNIYNNTFTPNLPFSTQVIQGGLDVTGLSVLPLTNVSGGYPLSGTTFLDLYSCYSTMAGVSPDANRVTSLRNFLSWYYSPNDTRPTIVMQQSGFNPVPAGYAALIRNKYLLVLSANVIQAAGTPIGANRGCVSAIGAL
ncbi:substrate-binding domain-containing protein [Bradyrhizobium tropiciagri]|uniref:substrate-binding domain-containing protein n=1 Tax=Bradyrhizobium tropiciagri TaxID=312253 RepID=UPI001BAB6298|nr:substrate-binding domain-containing protein [Bradyrhizobium tropiciagri]MBR0871349.1 substrate-binding domain-containing protein [Bradyrhizobium tropiciagri]